MKIPTLHLFKLSNKRLQLCQFAACFALANVMLNCIIGMQYLLITLASKTLFVTTFGSYSSFFGKTFVILFTLTTFLGQLSLLAFIPLFIMILPLIILTEKKILILPITIFIYTLCIISLLIDSYVFSTFHFHVNLTILNIIFSTKNSYIAFFDLSNTELLLILAACTLLLLLEISMSLFIWKMMIVKNRRLFIKSSIACLLSCLGISYMIFIFSILHLNNVFAQQTANFPLYNNILAALLPIKNSFALIERFSETRFSQPLFPVAPLHYPLNTLNCTPLKKPYNILMLTIDTWRFDALNRALTPQMMAFANNASRYNNHFSGGNSTQAGLFSLFYGLPSNYWNSMQQQNRNAVLIETLMKQKYQTNIIFSSDMIPPFNETVFYGIHPIRTNHALGETIPDRDRAITKEFAEFIKNRDKNRPFYAFMLYDAAHAYCNLQNFKKLYPSGDGDCSRLLMQSNSGRIELYRRYQNAIHFVDEEIGQVLALLKQQKLLDHTIVILTGDHGEEFDDNHQGYFGHGSNYTDYQIRTPLIISYPKQPAKIFNQQTSHYDIAPYLMQQALGCRNPISDYAIGKDLSSTKKTPYLIVGSYMNMAIVEKNKSTTLLTSGNIRVSDRHAQELVDAKPNATLLAKALLEMRQYYRHSFNTSN